MTERTINWLIIGFWVVLMAAMPSYFFWDLRKRRQKGKRRMQEFQYRIRVGNKSLLTTDRYRLESIVRHLLEGDSKLQKGPVALNEISITLEPTPPPPPDDEWKEQI